MFYDRKEIKMAARERMKQNYWMTVRVLLIFGLLGGGTLTPFAASGDGVSLNVNTGSAASVEPLTEEELTVFFVVMAIVLIVVAVAVVLSFAYTVLVGNVILAGTCGWLHRTWQGEKVPFADMFGGFRHYKAVVGAMGLRTLYTFLWSLLFFVPGIIKGYSYSMTGFILSENPALSPKRALAMSETMTDGHKGDLFVQDLSFWGWGILSGCTFGILNVFFLAPYQTLAVAGAYDALKREAIACGRLDWADFGQTPPSDEM